MQSSFFDLGNRYAQLNKLSGPLIGLDRVIDWELFRAPLSVLSEKPRKSLAGRKQIDRVLLFKMLVLQRLYNLADEALEYQVKDRHRSCASSGWGWPLPCRTRERCGCSRKRRKNTG